jgi:RNA polymerase sigma-70 factor (ECF subfamily)
VLPTRPTAQAVFAEHAAFVLRSVRRLGVRPADVEDVAQEVFVIVHRKLDSFSGTSSMRTWLFGIALRVASDYRRKAYVRREQLDDDRVLRPESAVPPDQAEALRRKELRALLDRAVDVLDDNRRAVFVLYELESVPMAEIAQSQGCALFTAYGRLREARAQVRARFEALQKSSKVRP